MDHKLYKYQTKMIHSIGYDKVCLGMGNVLIEKSFDPEELLDNTKIKTELIYSIQCSLQLHEIVEGLYFYFSLSVCVCVCVCVCLSVCEQNADRTATPILTRSSLNSCVLQSLKPY